MSEAERAQALREVQLELFQLKREYELKRRKLNHAKLKLIRGKGEKRCRKCSEVMDVEQFYRDWRYTDGLYPYCRECKARKPKARAA